VWVSQALLQARAEFDGDERKVKFNSLNTAAYEVSAEDVEAYKMTKSRAEDPMANFKDSDSEREGGSDSDSSGSGSSDSGRKAKKSSKKRKPSKSKKPDSGKRRKHRSDSD
jgi:hypothetical protein